MILSQKSLSLPIQIKAAEHYFPVVLFIMLYKVVLTIEFIAEIILCLTGQSSADGTSLISCRKLQLTVVLKYYCSQKVALRVKITDDIDNT